MSPPAYLDKGYAFTLHKTPVIALPQALLWLPRTRTLIASDLHFEKGSAFAAKGALLPPFDTTETLARLMTVIAAFKPELLIALGDSFHDIHADSRLHTSDKQHLLEMSRTTPTVWIEGNHDPEVPSWLEGGRCATLSHDGLVFTHEPSGIEAGEVAGHLHPCARITGASGRSIRRRCFVSDGRTLVMPAFGAFTGGLNVRDSAFENLFSKPPTVLVPGGTHRAPTNVRAIMVGKLDRGP
jgi:uncharacterized protein